MRLDVAFTPAETRGAVGQRNVVVIDVLRASSTIVQALVNGARSVIPVASVDEAARKAEQIGRDAVLLCGERDAEPIRGFHLGNSPLEFTAEAVAGRTLLMTTTNGTAALLAAAGAGAIHVGSLLNVSAVAQRILTENADTLLLCAGREGAFAAEDAACAGRIVRAVRRSLPRLQGNDAMRAAARLAAQPVSARMLARTAAGRRLREIGREEDLAFCAREDLHNVVPVFDGHRIQL
ncbi:MAG TPA: 2-phosphosulfolactate phosphatase [Longimicrobiales bacterium]|nr:2-phosphosulfolactate phosphatase [Longimicrobiales bacterium]